MSDIVKIEKLNEVFIRVIAEPSIKMELAEYFTFMVANYKFTPAFKFGSWDGKIRLMNTMTGVLYYGLLPKMMDTCEKLGYKVILDPELTKTNDVPDETIQQISKKFKFRLQPRDYQEAASLHCLRNTRTLLLCPTASGKSLIIYTLFRYYQLINKKTLLIVPLAGLVKQMSKDFIDYNNGKPVSLHEITGGVDKNIDADVTVTTWQSIQKQPKEWFEKFDVVIGDEAHLFKAKVLTSIMEKCINIKYRFGFTGSLDDSQTNKLVLTGLFGPIHKVITTKELQDNKTLSALAIKVPVLSYSETIRKENKAKSYQEEIDWIVRNEERNLFIQKLSESLEGNTLILFQFVEKHGKVLYDMLKSSGLKNVHFIHGGIKLDEREYIRETVETTKNNTIIASYATFATGTNIVNLYNIIFASPSKSKIRNLQSIGRVLRKGGDKFEATLYDLVDDLQYKSYKNYAIKHFIERSKIYTDEGFKFTIYNIKMKG